jgi:hypothetical protein
MMSRRIQQERTKAAEIAEERPETLLSLLAPV